MFPDRDVRRAAAGVAFCTLVGSVLSSAAVADSADPAAAQESVVLCNQADDLSGTEQAATIARGVRLAEDAVAADDQNAKAHFALACNLGKQLKVSRMGLSSWSTFRRMRRELDAALALAPDDSDALTAKGALLQELPRLLGGDPTEAERLLRRALTIEPDNGTARRYLAQLLEQRGATDEARALLAAR